MCGGRGRGGGKLGDRTIGVVRREIGFEVY